MQTCTTFVTVFDAEMISFYSAPAGAVPLGAGLQMSGHCSDVAM